MNHEHTLAMTSRRRLIAIFWCFAADSDCIVVFRRIMIPTFRRAPAQPSVLIDFSRMDDFSRRKIPSMCLRSNCFGTFRVSDFWSMFSFVSIGEAHVNPRCRRRRAESGAEKKLRKLRGMQISVLQAIIEGSTFSPAQGVSSLLFLWCVVVGHTCHTI